jgi:hypothetical protein
MCSVIGFEGHAEVWSQVGSACMLPYLDLARWGKPLAKGAAARVIARINVFRASPGLNYTGGVQSPSELR